MKRLAIPLLCVSALTAAAAHGQTANDSMTYWVNQKYIDCIDSGNAVCKCQEQNNYLILHLDTSISQLTVKPSIYYSWETIETTFKQDGKQKNKFNANPVYGIDSGTTFNINKNTLVLTSPGQTITFSKIKVKRIDKWIPGDLWKQIAVLACRPLLKYSIKLCGDSCSFPLTTKVLLDNISNGTVTISCSDDFHYNEMYFHNTGTAFFLVYDNNSIKAYKHTMPRGKGEEIYVSKMKDCQLFYKK